MHIVYTLNGILNLVTAAPIEHLQKVFPGMTQEKYIAHVYERSIPEGATDILEVTELPDFYFMGAWVVDGGLKIDMAKAREVHMNEIRKARAVALAKLDIETMKGVDVQAEKQALRDLPKTFDLTADTPEQLKALWPSQLEKYE